MKIIKAALIVIAIIVVFLAIFVYLIIQNNNKTMKQIDEIVSKVVSLENNDHRFEEVIEGLTSAVKEVATTNRIMADTLNKLYFYNKELHKKIERHDEKSEKIYNEVIVKRW